MADTTTPATTGRPPTVELQLGGTKLAAWANHNDWSIRIAERRFKDPAGQWKGTPYFRTADLPTLIYLLQRMLELAMNTAPAGHGPGNDEPPTNEPECRTLNVFPEETQHDRDLS